MSDPDTPANSQAHPPVSPLVIPSGINTSQLRASRQSDSPSTPKSPSHQRQTSIADMLATPPPLSSEYHSRRRSSNASNRSSDDGSSVASLAPTPSGASGTTSTLPLDWQDVQMLDLVQPEHLVFVNGDTSVENAFDILAQNQFTSLPIKLNPTDTTIADTFDYADLNAYLLLVLGRIEPVGTSAETLELVARARSGRVVPVQFAAQIGEKNPFMTLKSTDTIANAVEVLGNGVHRLAIADAANENVVIGILSQRRLIRFIWENGRLFKSLEPLFQKSLADLGIGSKSVISIHGDELVIDALQKMHDDGVSSLAVTDSSNNLLGNISIVDVRLVTKASQKSLLRSTCKNFLSVILNKRGLDDGKDSFPVFHVTAETSLGRTIAKLVATKSHRLWIVQPPTASEPHSSVASSGNTAGQLTGVVSLTDILYTLAKHAGKSDKLDPQAARRQRRRSSSSSVRSAASLERFRRSVSIDRGVAGREPREPRK